MKQGGKEMKDRLVENLLPNTKSVVIHDQRVGDAIADLLKKTDLIWSSSVIPATACWTTSCSAAPRKYVLRHAACSVWISRHHRAVAKRQSGDPTSQQTV